MSTLPLDSLKIERMASGHLCLNLSQCVQWSDFSKFSNELISFLGGTVLLKNEGVDMKLWDVLVNGTGLRLVFDDYPIMTSFESFDPDGDRVIEEIYHKLSALNH